MKRFCLSLILLSVVVFAFAPAVVVAEDQPVRPVFLMTTTEVSHAWVVGNTEFLQHLVAGISGPEIIPEGLLPLPWQEYGDKNDTRWRGATFTNGGKSYNLISFPWTSPQVLSDSEREELAKKIAEHPLGKFYYPDGNFFVFFPQADMAMLVPNDIAFFSRAKMAMLPNLPRYLVLDEAVMGDMMTYWQQLTLAGFVIGMYIDGSKIPPEEGETQKNSDENDEITIIGVRSGPEGELEILLQSGVPEGTQRAKAMAAHINSNVPFRVSGFLSDKPPLWVSYRIFPEDAGLTACRCYVSAYLEPPESREENKIYGVNISMHAASDTTQDKNKALDSNIVFRKGDFEFGFRPQEELPPEEGVPTAKEIDAANMALHKSLEPLANDIADKFAQNAAKGPVDIAAKMEDGILLFAVACEPGEDDMAIDWNRLNEIDLTAFHFPNPYKDEQEPPLTNIMILETETWQDMTMTRLALTDCGREHHLVLAQGNGILCGAVYIGEEEEGKETSPDAETIVPRVIAALKNSVEESQRIAAEEPMLDVPDFARFILGEEVLAFSIRYETSGGRYMATNCMSGTRMSQQTVLALAAQFLGGMFGSIGLAP